MAKPGSDLCLHIDDERSIGNSIIVTLRPGYQLPIDPLVPTHVFGVDTMRELRETLREVTPCRCDDCVPEAA